MKHFLISDFVTCNCVNSENLYSLSCKLVVQFWKKVWYPIVYISQFWVIMSELCYFKISIIKIISCKLNCIKKKKGLMKKKVPNIFFIYIFEFWKQPFIHTCIRLHHMNHIFTSWLRFSFWMCCVFQMSLTLDEPVFSSSLWGPSCDPLDQVVERCLLPELAVGDWLIFNNMGASGQEGPATFSDTDQPPVYYTISTDDW